MLRKLFLKAMPQLLGFCPISASQGSDTALPDAADITLLGENLSLLVPGSPLILWPFLCPSLTFGPWLLSMFLAICTQLTPRCPRVPCFFSVCRLVLLPHVSGRPKYPTCPQHTSNSVSATGRQLLCWPTGVIPSTLHPQRKSQWKPNRIEADCPDIA